MSRPFEITLTAAPDSKPDRLDRWLAEMLADTSPEPLSRSRLKTLILDGMVVSQNGIARDPSASVIPGGQYTLTIPAPRKATPEGEAIPLDIVYEDADIIVIDKPAGLVTHPAPGTPDGTLVNALIDHCGESLAGIGGEKRPGIVHRLDKDTSGVMVAAKTQKAHTRLTEIFAAHDLTRIYTAICWNVSRETSLTIDKPIGRAPRMRKKMAVTEKGREAMTHVNFKRALPPLASIAECKLETGRTHQIRVHLSSIGHGVIGDSLYGRPMRVAQMPDKALRETLGVIRSFPRQALHAGRLDFAHPVSGKPLEFESPLPRDMTGLITDIEEGLRLRGKNKSRNMARGRPKPGR